jgi:hypothetical protein
MGQIPASVSVTGGRSAVAGINAAVTEHHIRPSSPAQAIVAAAAFEPILATIALQGVGTLLAAQQVKPGVSARPIGTAAGVDHIRARPSADKVTSGPGSDAVVAAVAHDDITAGRADETIAPIGSYDGGHRTQTPGDHARRRNIRGVQEDGGHCKRGCHHREDQRSPAACHRGSGPSGPRWL